MQERLTSTEQLDPGWNGEEEGVPPGQNPSRNEVSGDPGLVCPEPLRWTSHLYERGPRHRNPQAEIMWL